MNKIRSGREFIHGVNALGVWEPVVVMLASVADSLETNAGLDEYRRAHRGEDPQVDEFLRAMHEVALAWRGSVSGSRDAAPAEPKPLLEQWITCQQAAHELRVGDRAIRKAIESKTLPAIHRDRRWWILRTDLARYRATRSRRN